MILWKIRRLGHKETFVYDVIASRKDGKMRGETLQVATCLVHFKGMRCLVVASLISCVAEMHNECTWATPVTEVLFA